MSRDEGTALAEREILIFKYDTGQLFWQAPSALLGWTQGNCIARSRIFLIEFQEVRASFDRPFRRLLEDTCAAALEA
jgi:hypothetical protein